MSKPQQKKQRTVMIAASSSGGHLLPARYVAEEISKLDPATQIVFIGAGRPLEQTLIAAAGFTLETIPVVGFVRRGLSGKIQFLLKLPLALLKMLKLFWQYRPEVVLGVGGYVSVLPVMIGRVTARQVIIHEAEKNPGAANKLLSYFARLATTAQRDVQFPHKISQIFVGQPINPALQQVEQKKVNNLTNLLIFCGSQGAGAIDQALQTLAEAGRLSKFEILHQSRPENIENIQTHYQAQKIKAEVKAFISDMAAAYSWSDLIIARSGLNSVEELKQIQRPVILIPLPGSPEQKTNALELAKVLPNCLIVEENGGDLADQLGDALQRLKENYRSVSLGSKELPNAALAIAKLVLGERANK